MCVCVCVLCCVCVRALARARVRLFVCVEGGMEISVSGWAVEVGRSGGQIQATTNTRDRLSRRNLFLWCSGIITLSPLV